MLSSSEYTTAPGAFSFAREKDREKRQRERQINGRRTQIMFSNKMKYRTSSKILA